MKFVRLLVAILLLALTFNSEAHIGSPNVFYDGYAGPYPVRVVIRPPGVIPGLAEISVRVNTNGAHRVLVLPIRWDTGKNGAPRPDEASLVSGETNLFGAQLWFMRAGAQSVEIEVVGVSGRGRVMVPVNAIATRVLEMPRGMSVMLGTLGAGLVILAASIFGGAVRESVLPAGEVPSRKRLWSARGMAAFALTTMVAILWFGNQWWQREAGDYHNNRLFRPVETDAEMSGGRLRLKFALDLLRRNGPLVPDHGKLMHLFLVREPGMDVFAHLHPTKINWNTFESSLPDLPTGNYRLYGDVTYETGFSDTLTTSIRIPPPMDGKRSQPDADDAWRVAEPHDATLLDARDVALSKNFSITRLGDAAFMENQETQLRFVIRHVQGGAVNLEPYMGMAAHLILRHDDGTVFTHLHPSGSFSMAAKQLFDLRAEGKAPLKIASYTNEPICRLPLNGPVGAVNARDEISFPYAFPKAGNYRLWVQTKIAGEILTGVFDISVAPERRR